MDSIEIKELTQTYFDARGEPFRALDHISLEWNAGNSIAIMGKSGSGKSTLARLMIGLERPSKGSVIIDGENTSSWRFSKWRKYRAAIQAVFQDVGGTLNPAWSTMRNVEEALCNFTTLPQAQRKRKIMELMSLTGLRESILNIPASQLSGGEQRRLALLRSLSVCPKFLILDEVTAGLDLLSTEAVLQVLEQYQREHDCTYFVITHDTQIASRLCKTTYEIENGRFTRKAVRCT